MDGLQEYEENKLQILENVSIFDEKLNDFRCVEARSVIQEKQEKQEKQDQEDRKIKTHILLHLEDQIHMIQQNFEKITHKQFDHSVYKNEEYKSRLQNQLETILGFPIQEYNQKTYKIEHTIERICIEIEILMQKLHDYIHHLHILQYKLHFISTYEHLEEEDRTLHSFTNLIESYESSIKNHLEEKTEAFIKDHIEKIHDRFNMIKLLQENLYQKVITKYSCGICLSNNIDCYYGQCGHVICKGCGIKNRNANLCPFCKQDGLLKPLFFI